MNNLLMCLCLIETGRSRAALPPTPPDVRVTYPGFDELNAYRAARLGSPTLRHAQVSGHDLPTHAHPRLQEQFAPGNPASTLQTPPRDDTLAFLLAFGSA
jgi:hypothetical protein